MSSLAAHPPIDSHPVPSNGQKSNSSNRHGNITNIALASRLRQNAPHIARYQILRH